MRKCRRHPNADQSSSPRAELAVEQGARALNAVMMVRLLHRDGDTGKAAMWCEEARILAEEAAHHALFTQGRPERKHAAPRRVVPGKRMSARRP